MYGEFATSVHEYTAAGVLVDSYPVFPDCASNDMDIDFAAESIVINGTSAPVNSLLLSQGECTQSMRAEDKNNGTDLTGQSTLQAGQVLVGGSWSAARDSHFAVTHGDNVVREYEVATFAVATVLNQFPARPSGSPVFDIFYGDIEVGLTTGNLYLVSSSQTRIRELTPTGAFLQDVDLGALGVNGMSGIGIDDATGSIWLSSTNGTVYRVDGVLPPAPTLSISDVTVAEDAGAATLGVSLSGPTAQTVTVAYSTADATATAGSDYTADAGTVTFAPGDTSETITIPITDDDTDEPNEKFTVTVTDSTFVAIADGTATATINDNDAPVELWVTDSKKVEGDTGTTTITFRLRLDQPSGWTVKVDLVTVDGTAVAPADYLTKTGTARLKPGQTVGKVRVTVNGDLDVEGNENFMLVLSSPSRATIVDDTGRGRIIDDD